MSDPRARVVGQSIVLSVPSSCVALRRELPQCVITLHALALHCKVSKMQRAHVILFTVVSTVLSCDPDVCIFDFVKHVCEMSFKVCDYLIYVRNHHHQHADASDLCL